MFEEDDLCRLIVLIFFTGPWLNNNESEEALAKKLLDSQNEASSYRKELGSFCHFLEFPDVTHIHFRKNQEKYP